jgi:8-oxo-dGTP diphosphatase
MRLLFIFLFIQGIVKSLCASEPALNEKLFPRVGVGVLVENEGKILLGQRKGAHGAFTWAPPGGHLEFGETVEECAKRELLEETGLKIIASTLGPWMENVMENGKKHYITLLVHVDQFEGELQLLEPDKCDGWQWFSWDSLPEPLFAPFDSFIKRRFSETALQNLIKPDYI